MSERLDLVLFGASGFTGKHAIPYVHKFVKESTKTLTWGIAGRSEAKLTDALTEMQTRTGIQIIIHSLKIDLIDISN